MMKPKRNYKPGSIDDCQTPGYAVEPILKYTYLNNSSWTIWDCACGQGYLVNYFRSLNFKAFGTDIKFGIDFLSDTISDEYDCIITNPPYSLKYKFVERCFELEKPWALLMPVETIGSKSFQIQITGDRKIHFGIIYMNKRVNFKMPNIGWERDYIDKNGKKKKHTAQFPVAWYVYKMGLCGNYFYDASHWTPEYTKLFEV